jgi:hypothetical protein
LGTKAKTAAKPAAWDTAEILRNWANLNEALRDCTEPQARDLLQREQKGKKRVQYLFRIHSRLNKARADRERAELMGAVGG